VTYIFASSRIDCFVFRTEVVGGDQTLALVFWGLFYVVVYFVVDV